jgi:hypothetical protein
MNPDESNIFNPNPRSSNQAGPTSNRSPNKEHVNQKIYSTYIRSIHDGINLLNTDFELRRSLNLDTNMQSYEHGNNDDDEVFIEKVVPSKKPNQSNTNIDSKSNLNEIINQIKATGQNYCSPQPARSNQSNLPNLSSADTIQTSREKLAQSVLRNTLSNVTNLPVQFYFS